MANEVNTSEENKNNQKSKPNESFDPMGKKPKGGFKFNIYYNYFI